MPSLSKSTSNQNQCGKSKPKQQQASKPSISSLAKNPIVVVKVGTATLSAKDNTLDLEYLDTLVGQIAGLRQKGYQVVLVTSGAIGTGIAELKLTKKPQDVTMRQALAAIGQSILMRYYYDAFKRYGITISQLLLTYDDFSNRKRFLYLKQCLECLLKLGVVPIINENDPISIDEIGPSFGDNDRLSALVASKLDAGLLILLTDIDAVYDKNPKEYPDAKPIPIITAITPELEQGAAGKGSAFATGGMASKIKAANVCMDAGIPMVICHGRTPGILDKVVFGSGVGTLFLPSSKIDLNRRWIKEAKPKGKITIDDGAYQALRNGKNLLPAGILSVNGSFGKDDVVELCVNHTCFAKARIKVSAVALKELLLEKNNAKSIKSTSLGSAKRQQNVIDRENLVFLL
ncbi:MAG: glutamate 5-kinase [Candidatus Woesearchaeota archaeon]